MIRGEAKARYEALRVQRVALQVKCNGASFGGPKWTKEDQEQWDKVEQEMIDIRKAYPYIND